MVAAAASDMLGREFLQTSLGRMEGNDRVAHVGITVDCRSPEQRRNKVEYLALTLLNRGLGKCSLSSLQGEHPVLAE